MDSSSPEISLKLALDRLFSSSMHALDRVIVVLDFFENFLVFSMKRLPLKVDIPRTYDLEGPFYGPQQNWEKTTAGYYFDRQRLRKDRRQN